MIRNFTTCRFLRKRNTASISLATALVLAACASTPPEPTVAMKSAEQAIAVADRTRVADSVSPELSEARDKLNLAHAAIQNKHMVEADWLAQESRVDAELASARIDVGKAKTVNDEMQHSTDTLTEEMQRSTGAPK